MHIPTCARIIVRRAALLSAGRVAALLVGTLLAVTSPAAQIGTLDTSGAEATNLTRAERIAARHDCWSGPAPRDVEPTRALVTRPGQRARLVPADVGYGIWLDHDAGVLHAFCP